MSLNEPGLARGRREWWLRAAELSDIDRLSRLAVAAGLACAVLFIVGGLHFGLQMYGDGSIFSYSVAVRDVWAFHWRNVPDRLSVYLLAMLPAEAYVGWFKDPEGGIALYGQLFFGAQLAGLGATYLADRSNHRILFRYACFSTACLCPLVFGFPTEMWFAHALFWPALALCHYAPPTPKGTAAIFIALLALVFTHAGGIIFAMAILGTVVLRDDRRQAVPCVLVCLAAALATWIAMKLAFPPDAYFAGALTRAALLVFDPGILNGSMVKLIAAALGAYGLLTALLYRFDPARAPLVAAVAVAAGLAVYWGWYDQALHAENRYYLRTAIVIATPGFGVMAAAYAMRADGRLTEAGSWLARPMNLLAGDAAARAAIGAFVLVLLMHAAEVTKFIDGWTQYRAAVRTLATGTASDPALGDPDFVSSGRIGADLNRLSWFSTTHFLSVLVAPNLLPARLVVDPRTANYFWLPCAIAQKNLDADLTLPAASRRLIRVHACLHRP